jgi:3-dehydroquinate synthase
VGQRVLAAAINAPVSVMETAGEGGAWGIALLAAYRLFRAAGNGQMLETYLNDHVFSDMKCETVAPDPEDLAGFAASAYMRGIDFYNIPTTVLSQVDSSVGGKVAIDMDGVKNCVGAFYPPKAVLIDPEVLKTLPRRQISNGLAEAVKMAVTFDEALLALFEQEDYLNHIDQIIASSLRIKAGVVKEDEKETGLRRVLNFGHTIGHGIESAAGLGELYHGECVALGMLPMCSHDLRPRVEAILRKLDLPTTCSVDPDRVWEAMYHDKKLSGDTITLVYAPSAGSYELRSLPIADLKETVYTFLEKKE